jgi:hypothetical protein
VAVLYMASHPSEVAGSSRDIDRLVKETLSNALSIYEFWMKRWRGYSLRTSLPRRSAKSAP